MSEQYEEIITIHFHGGTKAVAKIVQEDLEDESIRVEQFNKRYTTEHEAEITCAEELVQSALTVPPKPRWCWLGDAYVFTQAGCGIEYGANA